jgi:hypothetical protein
VYQQAKKIDLLAGKSQIHHADRGVWKISLDPCRKHSEAIRRTFNNVEVRLPQFLAGGFNDFHPPN